MRPLTRERNPLRSGAPRVRTSSRSPLTHKLRAFAPLAEVDQDALDDLSGGARAVGRGQDLLREGEVPETTLLVLQGFACRYSLLTGGQRQIHALLVPGDLCAPPALVAPALDHAVGALTPCTVAAIPRAALSALADARPQVARALAWSALAEAGALRAWLVGLGRREAGRRLAHLFCELLVRLRAAGVGDAAGFAWPLTQVDLADALGLTPVHVNRMLQGLRAADLVVLKGRYLIVPDVARLHAFADFHAGYLLLEEGRP